MVPMPFCLHYSTKNSTGELGFQKIMPVSPLKKRGERYFIIQQPAGGINPPKRDAQRKIFLRRVPFCPCATKDRLSVAGLGYHQQVACQHHRVSAGDDGVQPPADEDDQGVAGQAQLTQLPPCQRWPFSTGDLLQWTGSPGPQRPGPARTSRSPGSSNRVAPGDDVLSAPGHHHHQQLPGQGKLPQGMARQGWSWSRWTLIKSMLLSSW